MILEKFQIHQEIEKIVKESGTDYIDAALHYCQIHDIEIEALGLIISSTPNLMSKLQIEAENLNFIKKTNQLPI